MDIETKSESNFENSEIPTPNRDALCDMGYEDSIVFENPDYDSAIIGVADTGQVVYDYDLMIEHLTKVDNMTEEEAADFVNYNTIRSLPYAHGDPPIVMYKLI